MVRKEVSANGTIHYFNKEGQFHREDGSAIEYTNGTKVWYLNGLKHRFIKPAEEYADGSKQWWKNGKRHRLNAPAVIYYPQSFIPKEHWEFGNFILK